MDERGLRDRLVAAGARLGARGLIVAGEGNLSVRLRDERLLITPSGRRKDVLAAAELRVVPLAANGRAAKGPLRPSSDLAIHRAILAARPDVAAVVHAHPPAAIGLTLAGERPDPAALPETALFVPRLPLIPFREPGSSQLAELVAEALTEGEPLPVAVLLERHGAIAVGSGDAGDSAALDAALERIELVDLLCRVWRDAMLVRAAARGGRAG